VPQRLQPKELFHICGGSGDEGSNAGAVAGLVVNICWQRQQRWMWPSFLVISF